MQVIEVTDAGGAVVAPQWLALAEGVHRQLRTALPADYAATLRGVFRDGGRMCVAVDEEAVRGVAVYRTQTNTFSGRFLYVDDLVTDDRHRSQGVGRLLFDHIESRARELGCGSIQLDSGTQRQRAHKFYFREGMTISSFKFGKSLK